MTVNDTPDWLCPEKWLALTTDANDQSIQNAISATNPGIREMATLLSPQAGKYLEAMAQQAQVLTRKHFGRTIQLYAPLYLSNYCSGGCTYCGFASDRKSVRSKLNKEHINHEIEAMKSWGCDEVLLLTGERTPQADYNYLRDAIKLVAKQVNNVAIEVFPMSTAEYSGLVDVGCTGLTIYQETYDAKRYDELHRWGAKKDYHARLDAPSRALNSGMRFIGLGALLGLSNPHYDMLALYQHASYLQRTFWKSGISISFPRIRPQVGGYQPDFPINDRFLAQIIFAFRICLPTVPLVLSTRESAAFRDGMAGLGITKMSVASKTTVGGYSDDYEESEAQFEISDDRNVDEFCSMLHQRRLEPVFKNWDEVYRS